MHCFGMNDCLQRHEDVHKLQKSHNLAKLIFAYETCQLDDMQQFM